MVSVTILPVYFSCQLRSDRIQQGLCCLLIRAQDAAMALTFSSSSCNMKKVLGSCSSTLPPLASHIAITALWSYVSA